MEIVLRWHLLLLCGWVGYFAFCSAGRNTCDLRYNSSEGENFRGRKPSRQIPSMCEENGSKCLHMLNRLSVLTLIIHTILEYRTWQLLLYLLHFWGCFWTSLQRDHLSKHLNATVIFISLDFMVNPTGISFIPRNLSVRIAFLFLFFFFCIASHCNSPIKEKTFQAPDLHL